MARDDGPGALVVHRRRRGGSGVARRRADRRPDDAAHLHQRRAGPSLRGAERHDRGRRRPAGDRPAPAGGRPVRRRLPPGGHRRSDVRPPHHRLLHALGPAVRRVERDLVGSLTAP
ncbi:hypothetical protein [Ornithinimicrobium kibberense]|uniref:hypothetical protein n=1 Tax=Ornithinimicrobium kibberense TaxID=282060 RepID=UPI00361756EF